MRNYDAKGFRAMRSLRRRNRANSGGVRLSVSYVDPPHRDSTPAVAAAVQPDSSNLSSHGYFIPAHLFNCCKLTRRADSCRVYGHNLQDRLKHRLFQPTSISFAISPSVIPISQTCIAPSTVFRTLGTFQLSAKEW